MLVIELLCRLDQVAFAAEVLSVLVRVRPAMSEGHLMVDDGRDRDASRLLAMLTQSAGSSEATSALLLSGASTQALRSFSGLSLVRRWAAGHGVPFQLLPLRQTRDQRSGLHPATRPR